MDELKSEYGEALDLLEHEEHKAELAQKKVAELSQKLERARHLLEMRQERIDDLMATISFLKSRINQN